jgi:NDP-sugar pyrophosphorylase family protein
MRAIIMAGGLGTRLRPLTNALPKPLIPLGDRPILDIILTQLANQGFTRVTLCVGHLGELIKSYFGHGQKWGIKLDYIFEQQPLGTMGPLRLIDDLPEQFIVMNADLLTDLDMADLLTQHKKSKALATLATRTHTTQVEFGVLECLSGAEQGEISVTAFIEKPTLRHTTSMGIHALSRNVVAIIEPNQLFGLDHLMHRLLATGQKVEAYQHEGLWLDIGRHNDYEQAIAEFEPMRERLLGQRLIPLPLVGLPKPVSRHAGRVKQAPFAR